jgi:hypothetical protein
VAKEDGWDTRFYGGFAQHYYRDETTPEDDDVILLRDQLVSRLDFVGSAKKDDLTVKSQFIGSYRNDFEGKDPYDSLQSHGSEDGFIPDIAAIEARSTSTGLYGRIGRQSRSSGGVLGRFDGVHAAYDVTSDVTVNAVAGHPVDYYERSEFNTSRTFYGSSIDIADVWAGIDWTGFYIVQDNEGIADREAVGSELRYLDEKQSYYSLIDYDILFDELNTVFFLGNWFLSKDTSLNLLVDVRNSPILATTNAIQGQSVVELSELEDLYSESELRQLALDRTPLSKTVTAGASHQLNSQWQLVGDVTAMEFDDTPASGGVEAIPGTDTELYLSSQLIATSLIRDNDTMILGLRAGDTTSYDLYSMSLNWRVIAARGLRINPRIRFDYRDATDGGESRWFVRPFIRVDYAVTQWGRLELDLGYEWYDQSMPGQSSIQNTSYYLSLGYRVRF